MNVTISRAGGMSVTVRTGGVQGPPGPASPKGFGIDWPTNNENVTLMYTPYVLTFADMHVVLRGDAGCSVTFVVERGASRETADAVIASGVATDDGHGTDVTIALPQVAADQYVWLRTTSKSGVVREFHLTAWF